MKKALYLISCLTLACCFTSNLLAGPTMDEIEKTGKIKIGFRDASPPFGAFNTQTGKHEGFAVDMGALIVNRLSARFGKQIELVPVTIASKDRLPRLLAGDIDIEMGNTTHTQSRDLQVDFSLNFFFSDTTFIIPAVNGPKAVADLNNKRIGVLKGTTNLTALNKKIADGIFSASLTQFDKHDDGTAALQQGAIDIYCGDRSILNSLRTKISQPDNWRVADFAIGYEPYGFMVRQDNSDLRDFVDNTIIWTVQTKEFFKMYDKWMGPQSGAPIPMSQAYLDYLKLINYPLKPDWWKKPASAK